jgi:hypothetical protein
MITITRSVRTAAVVITRRRRQPPAPLTAADHHDRSHHFWRDEVMARRENVDIDFTADLTRRDE